MPLTRVGCQYRRKPTEDRVPVRAPRTLAATHKPKRRPTRAFSASPGPTEAADGTHETNRAPSVVSEEQHDHAATEK